MKLGTILKKKYFEWCLCQMTPMNHIIILLNQLLEDSKLSKLGYCTLVTKGGILVPKQKQT